MSEWGGSRGDVDIQATVLLGVEFFISVGMFVVVVWFVEVSSLGISVVLLYSTVY
jgi:hypothetical protein